MDKEKVKDYLWNYFFPITPPRKKNDGWCVGS
jgi:hypothetical protein